MTYHLGIDLGTTYTAAAVHRDGRVEMVSLGTRADSIPSVVFLRDYDTILAGEAANRRGVSEPNRVVREFKRRVGDPTPLLLGGTPYSAESLMAKLLRWVVDTVTEREGGSAERVALTHPANWGPFKQDLLGQAMRMADIDAVTLTEPEAAAIHYASQERIEPGAVIAVYDLGGGTFDAAVLRKTDSGAFEVLGQPEGIERLGGVDFDEAVFDFVRRALGGALEELESGEHDEMATLAGVARLREDCVVAKEALSSDTDASVPVLLPNAHTEVRITRAELESLIRPTLADTVQALHRALRSAGVKPPDVDRVLLVGGSSRIPLVGQLVSSELDRPVAADAHPKHAVALGAALAAAETSARRTSVAAPLPTVEVVEPAPSRAIVEDAAVVGPAPLTPPPPAREPEPAGAGGGPGRRIALVGGALVLALVVGAAALFAGGGDDDAGSLPTASSTEDSVTPTSEVEADVTAPPATSAAPTSAATVPPSTVPPGPFVEITEIGTDGDTYAITFTAHEFQPSQRPGPFHVHFFWDTTPAPTAGTNGSPAPGSWLVYDGPSPAVDPFFERARRPEGATAICALVADTAHAIADVDGDGRPDPGTGTCVPLPD